MNELPRDVLLIIFGYLHPSSLCTLACTCRRLSKVAACDLLWKRFWERLDAYWRGFRFSSSTRARDVTERFKFHCKNVVLSREPQQREALVAKWRSGQKPVIKCSLLGDGGVGKTSLIMRYLSGEFPEEYVPTLMDGHNRVLVTPYAGTPVVQLLLQDTAGHDYERYRRAFVSNTDVFLLCYSIAQRRSFECVRARWAEIAAREFHAEVPCLLVALKWDLHDNSDTLARLEERRQTLVSEEEGRMLAASLGASFISASSLCGLRVPRVFQQATRAALQEPKESTDTRCTLH